MHEFYPAITNLSWRRERDGWLLVAGRRRFGRVVSDAKHSGMWRSVKSGGQLSDLSNLSWAKNAVLIAAERELDFEDHNAIDPLKCPENRGCFSAASPLVRFAEKSDRTPPAMKQRSTRAAP